MFAGRAHRGSGHAHLNRTAVAGSVQKYLHRRIALRQRVEQQGEARAFPMADRRARRERWPVPSKCQALRLPGPSSPSERSSRPRLRVQTDDSGLNHAHKFRETAQAVGVPAGAAGLGEQSRAESFAGGQKPRPSRIFYNVAKSSSWSSQGGYQSPIIYFGDKRKSS